VAAKEVQVAVDGDAVLMRVPAGRAHDFAKAIRTRRFWGEPMQFEDVEQAGVAAWSAVRPGFSFVVVAAADPFVLLLEGPRESIEIAMPMHLSALRDEQNPSR
jgi:hypothetical protein